MAAVRAWPKKAFMRAVYCGPAGCPWRLGTSMSTAFAVLGRCGRGENNAPTVKYTKFDSCFSSPIRSGPRKASNRYARYSRLHRKPTQKMTMGGKSKNGQAEGAPQSVWDIYAYVPYRGVLC